MVGYDVRWARWKKRGGVRGKWRFDYLGASWSVSPYLHFHGVLGHLLPVVNEFVSFFFLPRPNI